MLGGFQRIDFESFPPCNLIAGLMQLPMVPTAKRHREFIADLKTDGSRLSKPQMMRIARLSPANQAGLGSNELQMRLVTQPLGLGKGELAPSPLSSRDHCKRTWWSGFGIASRNSAMAVESGSYRPGANQDAAGCPNLGASAVKWPGFACA
jgi:hypothetical protein